MSVKNALLAMIVAVLLAVGAFVGPNAISIIKFDFGFKDPVVREMLAIKPVGMLIEEGAEQGIFAINIEADGFKAMYPRSLSLKDVKGSSVIYEGKDNQRLIVMDSTQMGMLPEITSMPDFDEKDKASIEKISKEFESPYKLMHSVVSITPADLSLWDSKEQLERKQILLKLKSLLLPQCDKITLLQVGEKKIIQFTNESKDKPQLLSADLYSETGDVKVIVSGASSQEEINCLYRTAVLE